MIELIELVDLSKIRPSDYNAQYVGCLVLTKDHKLLLQQRGHDFVTYPDYLCEFGGRIEQGEEPIQPQFGVFLEFHNPLCQPSCRL
jgi:8-oxo-dGTP diphosphatase